MNPVDFPQANRTFTKPEGWTDLECSPLRVHDTGQELISCWQPTDEERAAIAAGAPIWLSVCGHGHPPVILSAESPFQGAHLHLVKDGRCMVPGCSYDVRTVG